MKAVLLATALILGAGQSLTDSAEAQAINDLEIAHIAVTASNIDIAAAHLALAFSTDPRIRQFAETMITDHSAVNGQAVELVEALMITPQDNDVSRGLMANAMAKRDELSTLRGAAFDQAYIANEVAYHEVVAQAVTQTLIPNAQNAELKALLEGAVPAFTAHLEHARMLAAELGSE